jgi:hypothetical protein
VRKLRAIETKKKDKRREQQRVMPSDSKRSGKKGDSKKKVAKSPANNAGVSKNRKLPGKTSVKSKVADKRFKKTSPKKVVDRVVSKASESKQRDVSSNVNDETIKRRPVHKKKSSQQKRKEYNEAGTSLVLVFPASKMRNAFKHYYVEHLSELSGVELDPASIQMESGIKSILLDLANCVTKPVAEISKELSCLKDKQTVERMDIVSSTRLMKNHDRLGPVFQ